MFVRSWLNRRACALACAAVVSVALLPTVVHTRAGDLNPPSGPVASSMVSLADIDSAVRGLGADASCCPVPPQAIPAEIAIAFEPISVGPIQGDEVVGGVPNLTRVISFSQTTTRGGGGGGPAGGVSLGEITIVKTTDKSSPKLFLACCTGEHIAKATLTCRKAGGTQQEYYKIELENVQITSYQMTTGSTSGGETLPMEEISFNFEEIKVTYSINGEGASADQMNNIQYFPPGPGG